VLPKLATCTYHVWVASNENAANLLRSLRRQQGRSLRSAAADIGVAPSQLSRLERGQRGLGEDMSGKLATYYGVPSEIIALSNGQIPQDIMGILQAHPELIDKIRSEYGGESELGWRE
jgi:transcriptional regulator with XRE-family HTH domain